MLKHRRCVLPCSWQTCARNKCYGKPNPATRPTETNAWLPKVFFPFTGHGKFMGFTNAVERRAARGEEEWDGMTEQEGRGGEEEGSEKWGSEEVKQRIGNGGAKETEKSESDKKEKREFLIRDEKKKKKRDRKRRDETTRGKLRHKMNKEEKNAMLRNQDENLTNEKTRRD